MIPLLSQELTDLDKRFRLYGQVPRVTTELQHFLVLAYSLIDSSGRGVRLTLFLVQFEAELEGEFRKALGVPDFFERAKVIDRPVEIEISAGFLGQNHQIPDGSGPVGLPGQLAPGQLVLEFRLVALAE